MNAASDHRILLGATLLYPKTEFVTVTVKQADLDKPEDLRVPIIFKYLQLDGLIALGKAKSL
jgi:hypothetical protein